MTGSKNGMKMGTVDRNEAKARVILETALNDHYLVTLINAFLDSSLNHFRTDPLFLILTVYT